MLLLHSTLEASGLTHVLMATHMLGAVLLILTLGSRAAAATHVHRSHLLLHHGELLLLLMALIVELVGHSLELLLLLVSLVAARGLGSALASHRHSLVRIHHVLLHLMRHAGVHLLAALVGIRLLISVHCALEKVDYL